MRHIFFAVHGRVLKVQDLLSIEFSEEIVMANQNLKNKIK